MFVVWTNLYSLQEKKKDREREREKERKKKGREERKEEKRKEKEDRFGRFFARIVSLFGGGNSRATTARLG